MYTTIIFDFFDVIHSDPLKRWLKQHGLTREGEIAEASQALDKGHIEMDEFYARLAKLNGQSPDEIERIFGDTHLIDTEMVALIATLRKHYKIGLLSNSRGDYIRPILEQHSIADLFDEIIVSSEVGMIKPHSEIFEFTLNKMNAKASETIFVDDSLHNVEAGESSGIKSILFTDSESLRNALLSLGLTF